jgi:6-phosphofructokinase 2
VSANGAPASTPFFRSRAPTVHRCQRKPAARCARRFFERWALPSKERKARRGQHETFLKAALEEGVHLIKPNLRELRDLVDEPLASKEEWIAASRRLIAANGVEHIALTLGKQGALLVTRDEAWFAEGLPVKPVSSVGAGDSFLGAMVWALSSGHSLQEALRYGVAAGSAAVLTPGTGLCCRDDVERLLTQVKVEAV